MYKNNPNKKENKKNTGNTKGILGIIFLISIIIAFLIIRWPQTNIIPIWDESVYLGMGKHLYSAGNSGLWESIRPVGLAIFTGAVWEIFGTEWQFYISRIFALIFSCTTIIMTYLIAKKIFGEFTGILAASLLAITPIFFHHSNMVLTDIISTFFMVLALYIYISSEDNANTYLKKKDKQNLITINRKIDSWKLFISGIFSGIAFLFRFPHGIMIFFLACLIIFDSYNIYKNDNKKIKNTHSVTNLILITPYKNIAKNLFFFSFGLLIILPFLIFNSQMYMQHHEVYSAYSSNHATLSETIRMHYESATYPIIMGSTHQGNIAQSQSMKGFLGNIGYYFLAIICSMPILTLSLIYYKRKNPAPYTYIKIYALMITYLLYLIIIANKQERFLLMILPIVCILASANIIRAFTGFSDIKKHVWKSIIAATLVVSVILSMQNMKIPYYDNVIDTNNNTYARYSMYQRYENITGQHILTTDPIFCVYSDAKFIPFYETTRDMSYEGTFVNKWESYYVFDHIIYTPASFPCKDNECDMIKIIMINTGTNKNFYEEYYISSDERTIEGYVFFDKKTP